jgi:hypothetical protein
MYQIIRYRQPSEVSPLEPQCLDSPPHETLQKRCFGILEAN